MTSESGKWKTFNSINLSYSTNGLTASAPSNNGYMMTNDAYSYPLIFEFTWMAGTGTRNLGYGIYYSQDNLDGFIWGNHWNEWNYYFETNSYASATATSQTTSKISKPLNAGDKIKLIIHDNMVELYQNDVLIVSKAAYKWTESMYWGFYNNTGRTQTIKDFKVKPYSEV